MNVKPPVALMLLSCLLLSCASAQPAIRQAAPAASLEEVFDRVHSSVVTLRTVARSNQIDAEGGFASVGGVGSGVLISADGKILTAAHVVHSADKVEVQFADGTLCASHVIGSSRAADVALIQLDEPIPAGASVAKVGDSDQVRVASQVFVVGAPLGISHTLTVGHVSARRKNEAALRTMVEAEFFQTDAAINKGNSGGPMFDMAGNVIGIVSYIVSQSGGSEGLGFAVTSNVCKKLLIDANPFWSGIEGVFVAGEMAKALNIPDGRPGMLIQRVAENSPGQRLGLRGGTIPVSILEQPLLIGGDIIIEAFGIGLHEKEAMERIYSKIASINPGEILKVEILRSGKRQRLAGSLEQLQAAPQAAEAAAPKQPAKQQ